MKYTVKPTGRFRKDYKLAIRRGQKIELLDAVIARLAKGEALEPSSRDHELSGEYAGHRECHITPDWLLIYRVDTVTCFDSFRQRRVLARFAP
jgi:mRNA interferase YafQ